MKVSEWLERQGLTIDSEIPEEMMDGLSEEDKKEVRTLARCCGNMEHVNTYISWLKEGDVALFNTGSTLDEALEITEPELGNLYYNEKVVPVKPLEYFSFRYTLVSYVVVMRFTKVE